MTQPISSRLCLAAALVAALAIGSMVAAERSSSAMATAATRLVNALTPDQRQPASFAFDSNERLHWHFIPTETFPRKGLLVQSMNESQRKLAHDLLKAGLSQRGYLTATSIMDLETVLGALEQRDRSTEGMRRDPVRYYFSIFG